MRTAIMAGISGSTGRALLDGLVNNRHYRKIILLSRRENRRVKSIHVQKIFVEFSKIEENANSFENVDDVFCLLGTEFINTNKLSDAIQFEYEYPLSLAKVAKEKGVKNFFLLNSSKANAEAPKENLKLRAKLAKEINLLGFENFYEFKVNGVSKPVNVDSSLFAAKKSLETFLNLIGMGLIDKVKLTPANIIANKMIEVATSNSKSKREFHPKDF